MNNKNNFNEQHFLGLGDNYELYDNDMLGNGIRTKKKSKNSKPENDNYELSGFGKKPRKKHKQKSSQKRKLSTWNRFVSRNKSRKEFRKNNGRLDFKKLSTAFRRNKVRNNNCS